MLNARRFFSCFVRVAFAPPHRPTATPQRQMIGRFGHPHRRSFLWLSSSHYVRAWPEASMGFSRHGFQGVSLLHWPVLLLLLPTSLQHSAKFNLRSCKPHDPFSTDATSQDLVSRRPPDTICDPPWCFLPMGSVIFLSLLRLSVTVSLMECFAYW